MKVIAKASPKMGKGVFATSSIKPFEVVASVELVRQVTDSSPLCEGEKYEHQMYLPDGSVHLVAEPMCFTNHSCAPNSFLYSADRQYFVIAKQSIEVDEEVTIDYELFAIEGDTWECQCGAPSCRGLHKWDFFSLPAELIAENLPFLDPWFASVHGAKIKRLLQKA
ncbi:MAG: SET domain-containing protein [Leptolyngbya sp. SIOISBB]|nr:SET domain-containing protein [Leptolyngbya sp. SIOISBB]